MQLLFQVYVLIPYIINFFEWEICIDRMFFLTNCIDLMLKLNFDYFSSYMQEAEGAFEKVLNNCKVAFFKCTELEIEGALMLNPFEDLDSIVHKYYLRIEMYTQGNIRTYGDLLFLRIFILLPTWFSSLVSTSNALSTACATAANAGINTTVGLL